MTFAQEFSYITLLVLGIVATYATVGVIFWLFHSHRIGGTLKLLTNISPQMAAIIGLLFGLYMAFFANDIWSIRDRAQTMILQEADGLRGVLTLAESLPTEMGAPLVGAVQAYIRAAVEEWPLLAQGQQSVPAQGLLRKLSQIALGESLASQLNPGTQFALAQAVAQTQSARYHRLALSQRRGDPLKWFAVACLGALTLLTLALVHLDNWRTQLAAMLIYASAISVGFTAAYLERSPFQVFVVSSQPLAELVDPPQATQRF
jgi:putative flippase GtrA